MTELASDYIPGSKQTDSDRVIGPETDKPPKEIELKVVDIDRIDELEHKLKDLGAVKVRNRRLIKDHGFLNRKADQIPSLVAGIRIQKDRSVVLYWIVEGRECTVLIPDTAEGLKKLLIHLGLPLDNIPTQPLRDRRVRLREESDHWEWTVKSKRKKDVDIDERREAEVRISDPNQIMTFLSVCGYELYSYAEKYRTEYHLGTAKFMIDEYPDLRPYLEIEGESPEQVFSVAAKLGYGPNQTAAVSTDSLARAANISEERLKNWRFT